MQNTRPYGFWLSPITSDLDCRRVDRALRGSAGRHQDLLARGAPAGARPQRAGATSSRRHAAGGDAERVQRAHPRARIRWRRRRWCATMWCTSRTWRTSGSTACAPGTDAAAADTGRRRPPLRRLGASTYRVPRWIGVRESHAGAGGPVDNTIVAVDSDRGKTGWALAGGNDFYSSPRLSPDGERLAWLTWRPSQHAMGRDRVVGRGHRRRTARLATAEDGRRRRGRIRASAGMVAGRRAVFHLRPQRLVESLPAGRRQRSRALPARGGIRASRTWAFGMSSYAFAGPDRDHLRLHGRTASAAWRSLTSQSLQLVPFDLPYTDYRRACARAGEAVFALLAAPPPTRSICSCSTWRPATPEVLRRSATLQPDSTRYFVRTASTSRSPPRAARRPMPSTTRRTNPDYVAPPGDQAAADGRSAMAARPRIAPSVLEPARSSIWTSRGIARARCELRRQHRLRPRLPRAPARANGASSTSTIASTARAHLADAGMVDRANASSSRGGSAGGYTTLVALTFRDVFTAGASYYGVSATWPRWRATRTSSNRATSNG